MALMVLTVWTGPLAQPAQMAVTEPMGLTVPLVRLVLPVLWALLVVTDKMGLLAPQVPMGAMGQLERTVLQVQPVLPEQRERRV